MGNIYRGKVAKGPPGMQAAFIDIVLDQSAFLYVSDVYKDFSDIEKLMLESGTADQNAEETDDAPGTYHQSGHAFHIEELLSEVQNIMVQVAKEPLGRKGVRLTSHISLPGRHLVLMPTVDHIGISRRIESREESERLRKIIQEIRPGNWALLSGRLGKTAPERNLPLKWIFS